MTSGKRAKQLRRERPTPPIGSVEARPTVAQQHPLGPHAGAFVAWEDNMKRAMLTIIEENKRALAECTGASACPASVHHPSCDSVR